MGTLIHVQEAVWARTVSPLLPVFTGIGVFLAASEAFAKIKTMFKLWTFN